ncbi:MAG: cadherin domain-containing protein [Planctomycetaceae bacterium]
MAFVIELLKKICGGYSSVRRRANISRTASLESRVLLTIDAIAQPNVHYRDITGDNAGNLYVSGYAEGGDIDPGVGITTITGEFVASYTTAGVLLWVRSNSYAVDRIVAGPSGALWLAGTLPPGPSGYQSVDVNPGSGVVTISPTATDQSFLVKWNSSGAYVASARLTGKWITGLDVSATGEVAVGGERTWKFSSTGQVLWSQPHPDTLYRISEYRDLVSLTPSGGIAIVDYEHGVLSNYSANGALLWQTHCSQISQALANTSSYFFNRMPALDVAPDGTFLVAMYSAQSQKQALAKLNGSGQLLWIQSMRDNSDDYVVVNDVETDSQGRIYWNSQWGGIGILDSEGRYLNTIAAPPFYFSGFLEGFVASSGEVFLVSGLIPDTVFADQTLSATGALLYSRPALQTSATWPIVTGGTRPYVPDLTDTVPVGGLVKSGGSLNWYTVAGSAAGDTIAAGAIRGEVDLDPTPGVSILSVPDRYEGRTVIAKYAPSGALSWATMVGTTDGQVGISKIESLANGLIRIRGDFRGEVDFDPGSGSFLLNAGVDYKLFVWTLNSDGGFVSASIIPTGTFPNVEQVVESPTGEKTIFGNYTSPFDADPGPGVAMLELGSTPTGNEDSGWYVVRLNAAGQYQWGRSLTGSVFPWFGNPPDVRVLSSGAVVAVGFTSYNSSYSYRGENGRVPLDKNSTFMINWSTTGATERFQTFESYEVELSRSSIAEDGSVLLTGRTPNYLDSDFDFGPSVRRLPHLGDLFTQFVVKYDAAGALTWAASFADAPRPNSDLYNGYITDVVQMAGGGAAITGNFANAITFETISGPITLTARPETPYSWGNNSNGFVAILDSQGRFTDAWQYEQTGYSSYADLYGMQPVGSRSVIAIGSFLGTVDMAPGPLKNDMRSSPWQIARFLARFAAGPLVVPDHRFRLLRTAGVGAVVGQVVVPGSVAEDRFQFQLLQNFNNAFAIHPTTGQITLTNPSALTTAGTSVTLRVRVSDDMQGIGEQTEINVIISLAAVGQNLPPQVTSNAVRVSELAPAGTAVGQLSAYDPEGDGLTWSITAGNVGSVFAIDPSTGQVTIAPGKVQNFESKASYSLTLKALDTAGGSATAQLQVAVTNELESTLQGGLIVPLYRYPVTAPGVLDPWWESIRTSASVNNPITVIVNPSSGPNVSGADLENYLFAIERLRSNPYVRILGYVPTGYGDRPTAEVLADVHTYESVFRNRTTASPLIDGIFLDEMSAQLDDVSKYVQIRVEIKQSQTLANTFIVGNWGRYAPAAYRNGQVADVYLAYENTAAGFTQLLANPEFPYGYSDPRYSGQSFGAIIHGVSTESQMKQLVDDAKLMRFDYLYLTNDTIPNPFDTMPTYWTSLVREVRAPVSYLPEYRGTVQENAAVGTPVPVYNSFASTSPFLTSLAYDPDLGQSVSYSITGGNTGSTFAINPTTGAITVARSVYLNYESYKSFTLQVTATDNSPLRLTDTFSVVITVSDVNEPAVLPSTTISVREDVSSQTWFATLQPSDADSYKYYNYQILSGNTGNAFSIDSSGHVYRNPDTVLDFETVPVYTLSVQLTDRGSGSGPVFTSTATVTIRLTNVNETPRLTPQTISVAENSPLNTVVGQVVGSDPDASSVLTYSITAGNTSGAFAISPAGRITVANPALLNYEQKQSYTLTVKVQDNGTPSLFTTNTVTVNVLNANDAPVFTGTTATIPENSSIGTPVTLVQATDEDVGQSIVYSIASGNSGNAYVINPSTGQITVATPAALNFELATARTMTLMVKATDNGAPAKYTIVPVIIQLTNVNEAPVVPAKALSISENALVGTVVGTATAADPEGTPVTWSIVSGNVDNAFTINSSTGEIRVSNSTPLDYETRRSIVLTVRASDGVLFGEGKITISLQNVNEAPQVTPKTVQILENLANGRAVTRMTGSDPDAGQTVIWSIVSGNTDGAFAINPTTGDVTVANSSALDYETTQFFDLVIRATENAPSGLFGESILRINLYNIVGD